MPTLDAPLFDVGGAGQTAGGLAVVGQATWAGARDAASASVIVRTTSGFNCTFLGSKHFNDGGGDENYGVSRLFLTFDTGDLPGDAVVSGATLTMHTITGTEIGSPDGRGGTIYLYPSTRPDRADGALNVADFDTLDFDTPTDSAVVTSGLDTVVFDLATDLSAIVAGGQSHFVVIDEYDKTNVPPAQAAESVWQCFMRLLTDLDVQDVILSIDYTVTPTPSETVDMTYSNVISKIRARTLALKSIFPGWGSDGVLFELLNEKSREFGMKTKDRQATANLAIVAGTSTYTISSAIGSDVDEIQFIKLPDREIKPLSLQRFTEEQFNRTSDSDGDGVDDVASGTPMFYTVWNGVLTVTPVPSSAATAVVSYSKKISSLTFTEAGNAATIEINDEFIYALILAVIGEMYQMIGSPQRAIEYFALSEQKMLEAKNFSPNYEQGDFLTYHDA